MGYARDCQRLREERQLKLGQVVEAGAQLEWGAVRLLTNLLALPPQSGVRLARRLSVNRVLSKCSTLSNNVSSGPQRHQVKAAVEEARRTLRVRNLLLHSRWVVLSEFVEVYNGRATLHAGREAGIEVTKFGAAEFDRAIAAITAAASSLHQAAAAIHNPTPAAVSQLARRVRKSTCVRNPGGPVALRPASASRPSRPARKSLGAPACRCRRSCAGLSASPRGLCPRPTR